MAGAKLGNLHPHQSGISGNGGQCLNQFIAGNTARRRHPNRRRIPGINGIQIDTDTEKIRVS